jgi:hypothetical protein
MVGASWQVRKIGLDRKSEWWARGIDDPRLPGQSVRVKKKAVNPDYSTPYGTERLLMRLTVCDTDS